ncbi:hypothetical protein T281_08410 [Rhodomicrobium udaipurense JA643]|uniref:SPASM domain-containing protein n=1 Tax=Rhodomicrobium udaipurense TaxID=1202716 RepID=A0A8I1GF68_9HYPH|nr:SPASM domain-containing protein [Rhodomicrobium udaipurense]KAI94899.1 hypothetical protein T281_08410 [Rhodomicrobium udaipurense JA643]MBJ7543874.1 SPASM domain-containing protein [Rhodomicrobium udaipurense]
MDYVTEPQTDASLDTADAAVSSAALRDEAGANELAEAARKVLKRLGNAGRTAATASYKVSHYDIPVAVAGGGALLFNARTRSLILLSDAEAKAYRALGPSAFSAGSVSDKLLLQALVSGGHVVGATVNELATVRSAYENGRAAKNALTLTIAPTMACNFGCGYCFQGAAKPTSKMTPEVQDAILAFVKARPDLKFLTVVWYGGEPLMGRDALYRLSDRLISYCDKRKINYSAGIVSNAWFLDAEVSSQLYSRRIKWAQVTVDGDRATHDKMRPLTSGHGTFDRIIENIGATLDETPLSIGIRINVGASNVEKASALLDSFAEAGFTKRGSFSVYFAPIEASTPESGSAFDEKLARADFNARVLELETKAQRLGLAGIRKAPGGFSGMCVAASNGGYVISGNGDVHKCWETTHDPSKRVGTIFEPDTLGESVNASLWQEWTPFDNDICSQCKILPMCGGHCAHRFIYGGPDQNALPCPSWKWNTAEYIFSRAKDLGVVRADQWMPEEASCVAMQAGARHSPVSLQLAQLRVLDRVSVRHGRDIGHSALFEREPDRERSA